MELYVVADLSQLTEEAAQLYRDYAAAYAETLLVGEAEPSAAGLDPELVREIRAELEREWRRRVRKITRRGRA